MKLKKTWQALLLAFALVVSSMANDLLAKAETTNTGITAITVTLRVEQDEATMASPVQIQLTEADKRDFGIGLSTEMWTPLHALAKYMEVYAGATDETLSNYLYLFQSADGAIYINDISTAGNCGNTYADSNANAAANGQEGVYWIYTVNNAVPSYMANQYPLENNDSIVYYGLWGGLYDENWNPVISSCYTAFDKTDYETEINTPCEVVLNSYESGDPTEYSPVSGASIIAGVYSEQSPSVTKTSAIAEYTTKTDSNGTARITFKEPGTYVLSAYREVKTGDTIHYDISRPYAVVTVKNPPAKTDDNVDNKNTLQNTIPPKTDVGTITPYQTNTAKMPAKVTKLKASVKKSKKKKKSVKLSWKKATNATAYQIYISKSKKSGYKKQETTKSRKKTIKLSKGTYYIKVRAYNKNGAFYKYGKFSNVVKVKIKNK